MGFKFCKFININLFNLKKIVFVTCIRSVLNKYYNYYFYQMNFQININIHIYIIHSYLLTYLFIMHSKITSYISC